MLTKLLKNIFRASVEQSPKFALVQYAAGGAHQEMLNLTERRHRAYCEQIGAEYLCSDADTSDERTYHWRKIRLIEDALVLGFDKVIWLDSDAVIVDTKVNLFDLVGYGIGVCECFDSPTIQRHLNTGVVWAVNSPEVLDFVREWDRTPRNSENAWQDQNAFIQLMKGRPYRDLLTVLPNRFNHVELHMEARDPVVRHYAGDPDRIAKMRALLRSI